MQRRQNYWTRRPAAGRLSRRKFMGSAAGVGAGAAGLALVGCGNDDDTPADDTANGNGNGNGDDAAPQPTPDESEVQRGGRLRTGTYLDVLGIDPHIEVSVGLTTAQRVYTYLGRMDDVHNEFHPLLASDHEQPSDTEHIFHLREDANFHDIAPVNGRQVTAQDVLYSLERFRDLPEAQNNDFFKEVVESMEAVDDYTFRVTTHVPYAEALSELGGSQAAIVPQEAVEEFGDLSNDAIGAGPYMLEEYVRGESELLVRNPDYFDGDLPYLDEYHRITILDNTALLQAYEGDELDINGALLNALDFETVEQLPDRVSGSMPALHYASLGLNASMEPFNDPRVREAIYLALDPAEFIDRVGFGEGRAQGALSPGLEQWAITQDELEPYVAPNRERARELLAEAGYENGFDLVIDTSQGVQLYIDHAEIVVPALQEIGINAELQLHDLSTYLSTVLFAGDFHATVFTHNPYETPNIPLGMYHRRGIGTHNWFGYENDEVSDLIDAQSQELDLEARQERVRDAQFAILDDRAPMINLFSPTLFWSYHERVGGYDPAYRGFQNSRYTEFLRS